MAIVDDADHGWLSELAWHAHRVPGASTYYAMHSTYDASIRRRGGYSMHRLIMGFPDGQVDHRDRNGLNNQRSNLRLADNVLNAANSKRRSDNRSGFKGVNWRPDRGKWRAYIHVEGRFNALGHFDTAEEAARAYDERALEVFGPFALLNFPMEVGQHA